MTTTDVSLRTVDPRATAVVSQTTTWKQFPGVWRSLLDEVYGCVRGREEKLAPNDGPEVWRNAFLYLDDKPTVEIGVLVAGSFEPHGRVVPSRLPGGDVATAVHRGDYAELGRTHNAVHDFIRRQRPQSSRPVLGDLWSLARGSERARGPGLLPRATTELAPGHGRYNEFVRSHSQFVRAAGTRLRSGGAKRRSAPSTR